ncbi:MAG: response regulator [Litoreibacter sp.]|nr:response regulator [Litoreibacter sp.]MCY4335248.1 response regulator [Litoreibacter sp.]
MTAAAGKTLSNRNILLVEDELFIAMAMEEYLLAAGAKSVACARSLGDAWVACEQQTFDVAVLDIRLPDGSPVELAKHLIACGVALIFHSGHADADLLKEFPSARFCSKPCAPTEILETMTVVLQENRSVGETLS